MSASQAEKVVLMYSKLFGFGLKMSKQTSVHLLKCLSFNIQMIRTKK